MSSTSDSFGRRAGRAFTRLVVTLLLFALLGAVGFLLSRLNARTFTLQQQDGKLLVMKGRMLPLGAEPYRPSDPALAAAYAPIDLLGGAAAGLDGARFDERDAMDRALFEFLEGLARPRLVSDDPAVLSQGLVALGRMQKLGGITDEQRKTLKGLESEVAFFQPAPGWTRPAADVAEAVTQLRLAADSGTRPCPGRPPDAERRGAVRRGAGGGPAPCGLHPGLRCRGRDNPRCPDGSWTRGHCPRRGRAQTTADAGTP